VVLPVKIGPTLPARGAADVLRCRPVNSRPGCPTLPAGHWGSVAGPVVLPVKIGPHAPGPAVLPVVLRCRPVVPILPRCRAYRLCRRDRRVSNRASRFPQKTVRRISPGRHLRNFRQFRPTNGKQPAAIRAAAFGRRSGRRASAG